MANVNQVLVALDSAITDGANAPDKRRVLSDEANTLRAVVAGGDPQRIGAALKEAERVLKMWSAY